MIHRINEESLRCHDVILQNDVIFTMTSRTVLYFVQAFNYVCDSK